MKVKEALPEQNVSKSNVIDKQWLIEQFKEMDAQTGFVKVPNASIEQLRKMMLANGIKPEDNAFSTEILRDRYPDDYPRRD